MGRVGIEPTSSITSGVILSYDYHRALRTYGGMDSG